MFCSAILGDRLNVGIGDRAGTAAVLEAILGERLGSGVDVIRGPWYNYYCVDMIVLHIITTNLCTGVCASPLPVSYVIIMLHYTYPVTVHRYVHVTKSMACTVCMYVHTRKTYSKQQSHGIRVLSYLTCCCS